MSIEDTFKDFIRSKVEGGSRRPGLHVSDLVDDCLRKPWYRMAGLPSKPFDHETLCNFYYGTAVHESFDGMFPTMEYQMCVNPFEELIEDEIVDIDKEMKDHPYSWVSGSADAINETHIIDFKTCKELPSKPSDRYVKQINFYSYMYYLHTGVEITKGAIIYIEKVSGFREHKIFEFDLMDVDSNRFKMMDIMKTIENDDIPQRHETTLCTVCPYRNDCDPHGFFDYKLKKMIR